MKVVLYMDVFPGQKDSFWATTNISGQKINGNKRYRFVVEIPDPMAPDAHAPVIESPKEVDAS